MKGPLALGAGGLFFSDMYSISNIAPGILRYACLT